MSNAKKVRPEELDYILPAIAPVFIIGMIGSLVYFLIIVCRVELAQRLMWILGCYTVAIVLIARIAIEQSRAHSLTYMLALSGAVLLVAPRYFVITGPLEIFSFPVLVCILIIVGLLADRITFDCTSVNEELQSSGVGLLQSLGLAKSERKQIESKQQRESGKQEQDTAQEATATKPKARKHNPGVWVLYLALLALPLFGLGQLTIQSDADRRSAFMCLFAYLLCSLCLLVLIALLSLRKYLRERGVPMETGFAIRWLAIGIVSVIAVLGMLSVLPIPGRSMLSMELPFRIKARDDLQSSRFGWGREGVDGKDNPQGKPRDNKQGEPNQKGGDQKGGDQKGGDQKGGDQKGGDQKGGDQKGGDQKGGDQKGGDQKGGDQKGGDQKGGDQKGGDQKGGDQKGGDQKGGDQKGGDQKGGDQKGGDQKGGDQKGGDQKGGDQKGGDQKGDDQKGDDQKGGDQKGGDQRRPEQDQNAKQREEGQPKEQQAEPNKPQPKQPEANKAEDKQAEQNKPERPREANKPNQPPPPPKPQSYSVQWNLPAMMQWLAFIVLGIVALWLAIVYRKELMAAIAGFREWLSGLLGRKRKVVAIGKPIEEATMIEDPFPPFVTFANPFSSGARMPREQLVRHTYRAVLSWGYEHRIVRRDEETPDEYMLRLARRFSEQQEEFRTLGRLYSRIAYARGTVTNEEISPLENFWKWLQASRFQPRPRLVANVQD